MTNKSTVTIIIPVYKTEAHLSRCLKTVLNQTYQPIEVIVVDDGSPGPCKKITSQFEQVQYIRHDLNRGLFAARLTGVRASKGKYIAFVDADDFIESEMYDVLVSQIEKEHADVAQCGAFLAFEDGRKTRDWWYQVPNSTISNNDVFKIQLARNKHFYIWNKLYRRKLFEKIPEKYHHIEHITMYEDILFCALLFVNVRKMVSVEDSYYNYVYRENAETKSIDIERMMAQMKSCARVCELCNEIMKKNTIDEPWAIDINFLKRRLAGLYYETKIQRIENPNDKKRILKNFTELFREFSVMAAEDYYQSDRLLKRLYKRILPPFSTRRYAAKKIFRPIIECLKS